MSSNKKVVFLIACLFLPSVVKAFNIAPSSPPIALRAQHRGRVHLQATRRTANAYVLKNDCDCTRRESIQRLASIAGFATVSSLSLSGVSTALAVEESAESTKKKEVIEYNSKRNKFSITIPASFKVITKIESPKLIDGKGEQLFSALDLNSGTVITVHRERACSTSDYVSEPKRCNLVLPKDNAPLLSEETLEKDASKILVRHDDRDNAVLGGSSLLKSAEMMGKGRNNDKGLYIVANTELPTGGTYQDEMGLRKESTLTRVVKARVVSQIDTEGVSSDDSLLGIWVSAPLDEWQKPVMGTKLNQIMESIQIEGGRLQ